MIVGRAVARRRDLADLLERALDRGPRRDGVEPAREVGVVRPLHAEASCVAGPRERRDVGDRVLRRRRDRAPRRAAFRAARKAASSRSRSG